MDGLFVTSPTGTTQNPTAAFHGQPLSQPMMNGGIPMNPTSTSPETSASRTAAPEPYSFQTGFRPYFSKILCFWATMSGAYTRPN